MRTFRYDKLIRDGVLDSMRQEGCRIQLRPLQGAAVLAALISKTIEELREIDPAALAVAEPAARDELADALTSFKALQARAGLSAGALNRRCARKAKRVGGFDKLAYVDYVSVPDTSPWVAYYLAHAERYPEIANPDVIT